MAVKKKSKQAVKKSLFTKKIEQVAKKVKDHQHSLAKEYQKAITSAKKQVEQLHTKIAKATHKKSPAKGNAKHSPQAKKWQALQNEIKAWQHDHATWKKECDHWTAEYKKHIAGQKALEQFNKDWSKKATQVVHKAKKASKKSHAAKKTAAKKSRVAAMHPLEERISSSMADEMDHISQHHQDNQVV